MNTLFHDLRYAARSLRKSPGFTVAAVLTLALGIGITTGIFSVVDAVLLRPLPYARPGALVRIYTEFPVFGAGSLRRFPFSPPEFVDLRNEATRSWESINGWANSGVNLAGQGEPRRVTASFVTGGLFQTLGVRPTLGRNIAPADDDPAVLRVASISHRLWKDAFGADPAVVGRDVLVNGERCTIVGVMPGGFAFPPGDPDPPDLWIPARLGVPEESLRGSHVVNVIGRLRPGQSLEQGKAEIDSLVNHWDAIGSADSHHFGPENHTIVAYGFHDEVVRGVRPALRMLLGAVLLVLLIACVNVASLLLVRSESRQRETAIRGAMGATLPRLIAQYLTEGILLSLLGGALGLAIATYAIAAITAAASGTIPRSDEIGINPRVFLFAAALCTATGVVFGLTPLAHRARNHLYGALKTAGASSTPARSSQRLRQVLVVSELALALVLLAATGLMLRAFWSVQRVDTGLDPAGVSTALVVLPESAYPTPRDVATLWRSLEARLSTLPGVEHAALATGLPPILQSSFSTTDIEGYVDAPGLPLQNVQYYQLVSHEFFQAVGIRLIEGRHFNPGDVADAPNVAVVNETMARTFWPGRSPLGARVRPGGFQRWYTVVGVIADVKNGGVETPTGTELYLPFDQVWGEDESSLRSVHVVARSQLPHSTVINSVRGAVRDLNPSLPISRVRTLDDVIVAARSRPRFLATLLSVFSVAAVFLAAVGLYGVVAYAIAQRTREFGIRLALGAQPAQVLRMLIGRAALLTAGALACGLLGTIALARLLDGLLFNIPPSDPATMVSVSVILAAVALLSSYLAARRAARVDPMVALRHE